MSDGYLDDVGLPEDEEESSEDFLQWLDETLEDQIEEEEGEYPLDKTLGDLDEVFH